MFYLIFFILSMLSANVTGIELALEKIHEGASNHNLVLEIDGKRYFIRIGNEQTTALGADTEQEFHSQSMAAELGIAPAPLFYNGQDQILITAFINETTYAESLQNPSLLKKIMNKIRALHESSIIFNRTHLIQDTIMNYYHKAINAGALIERGKIDLFFKEFPLLMNTVNKRSISAPCHLDLNKGNILIENEKVWLIDWEYSAMADPLFDLAVLAAEENINDDECRLMLRCYNPDYSDDEYAYLYLYRIIANIRWALWNYIQNELSDLSRPYHEWAEEKINHANAMLMSDNYQISLRTLNNPR